MKEKIFEIIISAQNGCSDSMMFLVEKFSPILKKYAFKLTFEDSFEELQIFFIQLITKNNWNGMKNTSNGHLVNYIAQSISHEYVRLSKQNKTHSKTTCFEDIDLFDKYLNSCDTYAELLKSDIKKALTQIEFNTIIMHYVLEMTIDEIAKKLNCSRQAVNQ